MVGLPLVVLSVILTLVAQWWSHHVGASGIGAILGPGLFSGSGRMQPEVFSVTGIVPIAYTVFAFSLGAALGALLRRVTWSIVGALLMYAAVSLVMVTTIRPNLAPQAFVPFSSNGGSFSTLTVSSGGGAPWYLGSGYQFVDGSDHPGHMSAAQVGLTCEKENPILPTGYIACLSHNHVQEGEFYQLATNYWSIQWRESLIYVATAAVLLVTGLVLVRRWRA